MSRSELRARVRGGPLLTRALVPGLFIAFFLWFVTLRLLQHYSFGTNAYDLSIFDYALYYTLRGRFLWTPFLAVDNLLADHFSPLLLTLVPLYLFDEGPRGLLVVQAGMVVASGVPLYRVGAGAPGRERAALGITLAYFGNVYLMRGLLYDFHLEMWLPAFFLTGLWLIEGQTPAALGSRGARRLHARQGGCPHLRGRWRSTSSSRVSGGSGSTSASPA